MEHLWFCGTPSICVIIDYWLPIGNFSVKQLNTKYLSETLHMNQISSSETHFGILNSFGHSFDFISTITVLRTCFWSRLTFGRVSHDALREPGNQDSLCVRRDGEDADDITDTFWLFLTDFIRLKLFREFWRQSVSACVRHQRPLRPLPALCCVQVSSDGRVGNMLTLPCFLYTEITAPKTVSCFSPTSSERHAVVQDSLLVSSVQTDIINQDSFYLNIFKLMILQSCWFSPESFILV